MPGFSRASVRGWDNRGMAFSSRYWLSRVALCALAAGCLLAAGWAEQKFSPPKVFPAQTFPARDDHPQEKVAIAADPYDLADKAATLFHVPYLDYDLLPVNVVVTNDGDAPVSLRDMEVELVTVRRVKVKAATEDDVFRRISHPQREPERGPLPLPRKVKPAISKESREEVENAMFAAKEVPPHSTVAGFVFFDIENIRNPLAGGTIYVSGIDDSSGQELMFFEIPMEKYLTYQPGVSK